MASGAYASAPDIELEAITRRFGATVANDRIDLHLRPASIHALVGENGAGKSTLMRILFGLLHPDSGRIRVDGIATRFSSPAQALARGIGMIHQHFMLVPAMTVLENIILGADGQRSLRRISYERLSDELSALFASYGFDLSPRARVESLGVGERQRVEIARLLFRGAKLLICDEPTAVLAPPEVAAFFENLRRFRDEGRTIVFITHKLAEVLEIADRVTVLRRGRVVGEMGREEMDRDRLVRMIMGGGEPGAGPGDWTAPPVAGGEAAVLAARDVTCGTGSEPPALEGIDLDLRAGEILGIAGVIGNGQRELGEVISGRRAFSRGRLRWGEHEIGPGGACPRTHRPALIPEDRSSEGLIGSFRLWENLLLGRGTEPACLHPLWYSHRGARSWARPILEKFRVEPLMPDYPADALSGGNQQKVLCAREISRDRPVLVACQPTRGIDLASTRFIHDMLRDYRARGRSVLLISADLDEILELTDRVGVLYRGRLGTPRPRLGLDLDQLGREMVGVSP